VGRGSVEVTKRGMLRVEVGVGGKWGECGKTNEAGEEVRGGGEGHMWGISGREGGGEGGGGGRMVWGEGRHEEGKLERGQ